jgi:hypothetical protein
VTRFRGIIERSFGRLKQFKILRHIIDSNWIPKLHDFVRGLAAIINAYFPKIYISDIRFDNAVSERLLERQDITNDLVDVHAEVKQNWTFKPPAQLRARLPRDISKSSIRLWACGPNAEKLAIPYLRYAQNANGESGLKFRINCDAPGVLRVQGILSRFSSVNNQKRHTLYLHFGAPNRTENISSYCTCKSGARTVGGCVHAIAVLTHLYDEAREHMLRCLLKVFERNTADGNENIRPEHDVQNLGRKRKCPTVDSKASSLVNVYPWKKARNERLNNEDERDLGDDVQDDEEGESSFE